MRGYRGSHTRKISTLAIRILAAALFIAALTIPATALPRQFATAKFVFFFIGDGMGATQRNAAETYLAGKRRENGDASERASQLVMNSLPVSGMIKTDSLSGTTDSAAAGTALATGKRTTNGAVGMNPSTGERFRSIAVLARERGMRVGIVTSSFLQDATPAVFYGHAGKRTEHYALGLQLIDSGFEYFAGGGFRNPSGKDKSRKNLESAAAEKGYRISKGAGGLSSLRAGERAIAIHEKLSAGTMPWVIDEAPGPSLADFVKKGIEMLDCEQGFFMMAEGGKIDLACHANDAAAAVWEVIAFDEAIAAALEFQRSRPRDTLIVVTSDHETGGMSLSVKPEDSAAFYKNISRQRGSYAAFERTISPKKGATLDEYLARAEKFFGPAARRTEAINDAWRASMTSKGKRPVKSAGYKKLYGPYDPFTMACMREMNAAAGVKWTTFYHTNQDVPVSAIGAGAELFAGDYENTGIFDRLRMIMSL